MFRRQALALGEHTGFSLSFKQPAIFDNLLWELIQHYVLLNCSCLFWIRLQQSFFYPRKVLYILYSSSKKLCLTSKQRISFLPTMDFIFLETSCHLLEVLMVPLAITNILSLFSLLYCFVFLFQLQLLWLQLVTANTGLEMFSSNSPSDMDGLGYLLGPELGKCFSVLSLRIF